MMTTIVCRAWQTVKPHVPLIKFRKGGTGRGPVSEAASPAPSGGVSGKAPSVAVTSGPPIEDWQLPPRYRRTMIDEKEMDMINSGGAY